MSRINIANLKNFYSEKLEAQHFQVYADCVGNLLQGKLRTVVTLEMTEKNRQAAESVVEANVYGCPELENRIGSELLQVFEVSHKS